MDQCLLDESLPSYPLFMGNLGRYQEIVELAKKSGGVDAMITRIQKGAVAQAAPKFIAIGLAAGAALTVGVSKGYKIVKQAASNRREAIHQGKAAERKLRTVVVKDASQGPDVVTAAVPARNDQHSDNESAQEPETAMDLEGTADADRA